MSAGDAVGIVTDWSGPDPVKKDTELPIRMPFEQAPDIPQACLCRLRLLPLQLDSNVQSRLPCHRVRHVGAEEWRERRLSRRYREGKALGLIAGTQSL
jgi:hypothetical protein